MTQQINLLEPSLLPKHEWLTGSHVLVMGVLLVAGMAAQLGYERHAMKRVVAAIAAVPAAVEVSTAPDDLDQRISAAEARSQQNEMLISAAATLTDLPTDNAQRLQRLFAALPETVWLQDVAFGAGGRVRITGGAEQVVDIAQLAEALGRSPGFEKMPVRIFSLDREAAPESVDGAASAPAKLPPRRFGFVLSSELAPAQVAGGTQ